MPDHAVPFASSRSVPVRMSTDATEDSSFASPTMRAATRVFPSGPNHTS